MVPIHNPLCHLVFRTYPDAVTAFLFPSDPLRPRRPDEHFAREAAAAVAAGAQVTLVDHSAVHNQDLEFAVRRVTAGLGDTWYRGWMLPAERYAALEKALATRGVVLRTPADRYRRAHELPGWYPAFAGVTPPSVWTDDPHPSPGELAALVAPLGGGAGIVKDFVKSRKHEWEAACFVPDLSDTSQLARVVATFVRLQGDSLAGGVVVRAFEHLDRGEARVWWLDGEPILVGPHPDTPNIAPGPDISGVPQMEGFITTDLALRDDGEWRVVEVGDGQVSDLPSSVDASRLIERLARG